MTTFEEWWTKYLHQVYQENLPLCIPHAYNPPTETAAQLSWRAGRTELLKDLTSIIEHLKEKEEPGVNNDGLNEAMNPWKKVERRPLRCSQTDKEEDTP